MIERQQRVSRRQFLTTLGVLAAGTVALAACGASATPTVAPAATTAPAASAAPATTAPTAPATVASSAPSAAISTATRAASSAPSTAVSTATPAAVSTATRASTATAATPVGTRTTATASAAAGDEGDFPNGNYGGSKFYSAAVDQKVEISTIVGALRWDKAQYTAKAGDVTFVTKNLGPAPHQLGIEGNGIKYESANLNANTTTNLTIKGLKAGEYDVVCNVGNHKAMGMVAKLLVS